jgi:hypothetical protein
VKKIADLYYYTQSYFKHSDGIGLKPLLCIYTLPTIPSHVVGSERRYLNIIYTVCIRLRLVSIPHCNLPQNQIVLKILSLCSRRTQQSTHVWIVEREGGSAGGWEGRREGGMERERARERESERAR